MKLGKEDAKRLGFVIDVENKVANRPLSHTKKGRIESAIALIGKDLYLDVLGVSVPIQNPSVAKIEQLIEMFENQIPKLPF